jgi:hypothetical protein
VQDIDHDDCSFSIGFENTIGEWCRSAKDVSDKRGAIPVAVRARNKQIASAPGTAGTEAID